MHIYYIFSVYVRKRPFRSISIGSTNGGKKEKSERLTDLSI